MNNLTKKQRKKAKRVGVALLLFFVVLLLPIDSLLSQPSALYVEFALFLVPYLLAGYDVLRDAARGLVRGHVLNEDFLMSIATVGAFALVLFPDSEPHMAEGAAVMLFFQVGELFEDYAVAKSRRSIASMMDIAPDYANVRQEGRLVQVEPDQVPVGGVIVVKPGERVPLDGKVISGSTQLDTAALTGESLPRSVKSGDDCVSGCVNLTGVIEVQVTKPYSQSTVQRILDLVENASEKKARTESFISRFARYYTPVVVGAALLLAVLPPLLLGQSWSDWLQRGLIFLVVSCPCALVISVPLSFFGGIGGASRLGILVKGGNYLEALSKVSTVVFDKTGTLTTGSFAVISILPVQGTTSNQLLEYAALAESYSDHPLALSVRAAYEQQGEANAVRAEQRSLAGSSVGTPAGGSASVAAAAMPADSAGSADPVHHRQPVDSARVMDAQEESGHGVSACVDGARVLVGNAKLMEKHGVLLPDSPAQEEGGTVLHVAHGGAYLGCLVVADQLKPDARQALTDLRKAGVERTVMLTGDRYQVAQRVAADLGISSFFAQLLPDQKVGYVEQLLKEKPQGSTLAFVGDGINDAPVLMRADVGIAMGALGSDAAIEAADVVLMDDNPASIARAIRVARKTMGIVWQNIVFAIGAKLIILALAAFGMANLWLAVFGDVGVAVIAIVNAMRAMNVSQKEAVE